MSQLKNFMSKLPLKVITGTEITSKKVQIPGPIDSKEFTKLHQSEIESTSLTTEKVIHIASTHVPQEYKSAFSMLTDHLVNRK